MTEMCTGARWNSWLWLTVVVLANVVCSAEETQEGGRGSERPVMSAYRTSGENNGCTSVRFAYGGKGFSYHDVPLSMVTGL